MEVLTAASVNDQSPTADAMAGLIPYKNVPALLSYYLGILSLLPVVGLVFALIALPLGIVGIQKRRQNAAVRGAVHAGIGLGLGAIGLVVWGGLVVLMALAMLDG